LKKHKLFLKLFLLRVYKLNRAMHLPAFENGLLSKTTAISTEATRDTLEMLQWQQGPCFPMQLGG
jgi:hypothetical protein